MGKNFRSWESGTEVQDFCDSSYIFVEFLQSSTVGPCAQTTVVFWESRRVGCSKFFGCRSRKFLVTTRSREHHLLRSCYRLTMEGLLLHIGPIKPKRLPSRVGPELCSAYHQNRVGGFSGKVAVLCDGVGPMSAGIYSTPLGSEPFNVSSITLAANSPKFDSEVAGVVCRVKASNLWWGFRSA